DPVEAEGVRRARQRAASADLKLVVLDATRPGAGEGLAPLMTDGASIVVVNKADVVDAAGFAAMPQASIAVSAKTGEGVPLLLERLGAAVRERFEVRAGPALTQTRHRTALEECLGGLQRSLGAPLPELAAEDLRLAMRALGRITGRVDVEDLLDVIFRDFCIG